MPIITCTFLVIPDKMTPESTAHQQEERKGKAQNNISSDVVTFQVAEKVFAESFLDKLQQRKTYTSYKNLFCSPSQ